MTRHSLLLSTLLFSMLVIPAAASANFGGEILYPQCGTGRVVVNVIERVYNDVDTKQAGGFWAYTDYGRHIVVRETGSPGEYCAVVQVFGAYETVGGQSPAGTTRLPAGKIGWFGGGARMLIHGSVIGHEIGFGGTYDYQCSWNDDGDGDFEDGEQNCPGYSSWLARNFAAGYTYDYDFWGYRYYDGCGSGGWVDACTGPDAQCPGSSGDVAVCN